MNAQNRIAWRLYKQGLKKNSYMEQKKESVASLVAKNDSKFELSVDCGEILPFREIALQRGDYLGLLG